MATVTLDIGDDVVRKLADAGMGPADTVRLAAAFSLCSRGQLSTSLAARLAGLSYAEFLEAAARAQVELFPVNMEDLQEEISRGFTLGRQGRHGEIGAKR
jgi:predicted HTH domain antitoxin